MAGGDTLRVAIVVNSLGPGGTERVAASLARWLATPEVRTEPVILTIEGSSNDVFDPGDARRVTVWAGSRPANDRIRTGHRVRCRLDEIAPDVVVALGSFVAVTTLLASVRRRWNVVISERNDPRRPVTLPIRIGRRLLYRRATYGVALTEDARAWMESVVGVRRVCVIPNAIDPSALSLSARESQPRILSVGRLHPQKGHEILLRAFASLPRDLQAEWHLRIIGDGPLREHLSRVIQDLHLGENVVLVPGHQDIASEYADAEVFVLPSHFEGFPNVLLEAMANGLAVIASDLAGTRALVSPTETGLLVPADDATALRDALRELLHDPEARAVLSSNARRTARRFGQDEILPRWADLVVAAAPTSTGSSKPWG